MNLSDILRLKFPDAFESWPFQIEIRDEGQGPYIYKWNLEGIEQPDSETINQWIVESENEWKVINFFKEAEKLLSDYIDTTAKSKGYDNTLSITSYVSSTNELWKAEAETFISWRDSVLAWAYSNFVDIQAGIKPIPTLEELKEAIPQIIWPS